MDPRIEQRLLQARRQFLGQSGVSIGMAALASLMGGDVRGDTSSTGAASSDATTAGQRGLPGLPHFAPKAKRVIYLMQSGAPSHVDLFDYKPGLDKRRGEELPESVTKGQRLTTMTAGQKSKPFLPSISGFKQFGECGRWVSNFLPFTGEIADRLCFIKSMRTDQFSDLDGAAERILYDDDRPAAGKPSAHPAALALSAQGLRRPLPPLSMHRRRGRRRHPH